MFGYTDPVTAAAVTGLLDSMPLLKLLFDGMTHGHPQVHGT